MKKNLFAFIMLLCATTAFANDGVYFTSGNFLVPVRETDISVAKEILSINIGKDSLASVDVYYEFMNHGDAKTVTMAFEAEAPYNACSPLYTGGKHPYIYDFTVVMNGSTLPYDNAVVRSTWMDTPTDFMPLDLTQWKDGTQVPDSLLPVDNGLYSQLLDSIINYSYAYYFKAIFKPGLNIVHHTYSFMMSYNIAMEYDIPYWLTPATRWANHQIDDFTLRIKSERSLRDFCMPDTLFADAPFKVVGGGNIHQFTTQFNGHYLYAENNPDGYIEWHKQNFAPSGNIQIESPEIIMPERGYHWLGSSSGGNVVIDKEGIEYRYVGYTDSTYFVTAQDYGEIPKEGCRIVEYNAENGQGWVYISKNADVKTATVYKQPTTKSTKVCTIKDQSETIDNVYRCLGYVEGKGNDSWWYKVKVGKKIGYVNSDVMQWDSINCF